VLKSIRIKRSGHQEYIDGKRNAYFGWETSKKRPLGRPRTNGRIILKVYEYS
jgi:hypothetical protein